MKVLLNQLFIDQAIRPDVGKLVISLRNPAKPINMNLRRFILFICLLPGIGGFSLSTSDTLKVLAIGNSFSVDGVEYFDDLAHAAGKPLVIGNAMVPGCSLEKHLKLAQTDAKAYQYYKSEVMIPSVRDSATLRFCMLDEDWDFITFQQASPLSGKPESYFPYLEELLRYVKAHSKNPDLRFVIHQTWAYPVGSKYRFFEDYNRDQMQMYRSVVNAYREAAQKVNIRIVIPSGTAIQNGRTGPLGENFNRDDIHLNVLGRYTAGCVWFETLFKERPNAAGFAPPELNAEQVRWAQQAAHQAIRKPYNITQPER